MLEQPDDKYSGFTLIEIMLVVLLLAFIVLQIAQTQQQKAEANIVERTAGDMNDWQLSIINYYNQHSNWPPNTLKTLTTPDPDTGLILMPATSLCAPFAINNTPTADCGSYAEYTGQNNGTYYTLSIQTSSNNIATLLAAKLQNAWVTNNTVNTAIPIPTSSTYFARRGWIVSAGVVTFSSQIGGSSTGISNSYGSQIYLPNCPPGFEGHLITSPEQYNTNSTDWGIHLAQTNPTGGNTDGAFGSSSSVVFPHNKDQYGNTAYAITTNDVPDNNDTTDAGGIRHLGFFMTFCLPQVLDSNGNFQSSNWYTNYVNTDWLQDGQCSASWITYLSRSGNSSPNCVNTTGDNPSYNNNFLPGTLLGTGNGY